MQMATVLGLGRSDPADEIQQASDALSMAVSETQFGAVEEEGRSALSRAPADASAVSLLGLAEAQQNRSGQAAAFMKAASALSHRDTAADLWLFERAIAARRYAEAFRHGDALLRRDQVAYQPIMTAMAKAANDPAAIKPLAERLSHNPSWRMNFIYWATRGPTARFMYPLFDAMRAAGSPPTQEEVEMFLNQLAANGDYQHAYLFWLLSLSPHELANLGDVYDGDFEGRTTLAPFGWTFASNAAGVARIATSPTGSQALEVDSDGYASDVLASQLLVLPAGRYHLSGKEQTSAGDATDAFRWFLTCTGGAALIELPMGPPHAGWRGFGGDFEVPPEGCPGQLLTLKAFAGERNGGVTVWYDDLNVTPIHAETAQAQ